MKRYFLLFIVATMLFTVPSEARQWRDECEPMIGIATAIDRYQAGLDRLEPLQMKSRIAIHESFPVDDYEHMFLQFQITRVGSDTAAFSHEGLSMIDGDYQEVDWDWDLRNLDGELVKTGRYEIEVAGRLVPRNLGIGPFSSYDFSSVEGYPGIVEVCPRVVIVEVVDAERSATRAVPPGYYDTVNSADAAVLRSTLHNVIDGHTRFSYDTARDILKEADENPGNSSQIIDVYKNEGFSKSSTAWNREHTWPKSYGFSSSSTTPYTDCHMLRASDSGYNSARNNFLFRECALGIDCDEYPTDINNGFGGGSGIYPGNSNWVQTSVSFEVWGHRQGDVARTMFYMDLRYEGDGGGEPDLVLTDIGAIVQVSDASPAYMAHLSTLLAWHAADPVDDEERARNDVVYGWQNNRNPFVDHPEWVDCLFSNVCSSTFNFSGITAASDLDPCDATGIQLTWTALNDTTWNDECTVNCSNRAFKVYRDQTEITSGGCSSATLTSSSSSCVDDQASEGVTYSYSVEATNENLDTAGGTSSLDGSDQSNDMVAPVLSNVTAAPGSTTFTATWTSNEVGDSFLEWGETIAYGSQIASAALVTSHSLVASGLNVSTTYNYRVCSTDGCGAGPTCSTNQLVTTSTGGSCGLPFINEFHYDDTQTDANEFIEIAGPADFDLDGWEVVFYNGSGGTGVEYDRLTLGPSDIIDNEGGGTGALSYLITQIQNGSPDGFTFVDDLGVVQERICYEGPMSLAGENCTEIGVAEDDTTADTESLQRIGTGSVPGAFTWTGPLTATPGTINVGQTIDGCAPCEDLTVASQTVTTTESYQACGDLILGPDLILGTKANITGDAGGVIAFHNGFKARSGADLRLLP